MKRGIPLIALTIIAFTLIVKYSATQSGARVNTQHTDTGTGTLPTGTRMPELHESSIVYVSASDLAAAYEANEVAADRTYKGKAVEVTGYIDRVVKAALTEQPVVDLGGDVTATLDNEDDAAILRRGHVVIMRCTGGGSVLLRPYLDHCKVDYDAEREWIRQNEQQEEQRKQQREEQWEQAQEQARQEQAEQQAQKQAREQADKQATDDELKKIEHLEREHVQQVCAAYSHHLTAYPQDVAVEKQWKEMGCEKNDN